MLILLYLTRAQSSLKICTRSNKGKVVSLFNHPSIFFNVKQNEHNKLAGKKKKKTTRAPNARTKRLVSQLVKLTSLKAR